LHESDFAMNFMRQVSQVLDTEHRASLELLGRVEQALGRAPRGGAPGEAEFAPLAAAFGRMIEQDIARHFDFEERELFTRLTASGDGDIADLLAYEHEVMRAVAAEVLPLARAAAAGTLAGAEFGELRRGALEMVERQVSHIQKETMALLPRLDDLLDEETDRELAFAYASA
jgi:hemerythrin-like domain-containing protein